MSRTQRKAELPDTVGGPAPGVLRELRRWVLWRLEFGLSELMKRNFALRQALEFGQPVSQRIARKMQE